MAAAVACLSPHLTALAQTTTLQVTATPSIFAEMFEGFVEAFEAENPDIAIELDTSQRDQTDMIQALLRRAIINDLPDVSFQGYNYLRLLVDQGLVVPLDDFIATDTLWAEGEVSPSVAASGMIGDTTYGIGVGMSFPIVYYNADVIAGLQDGDPVLVSDWDVIFDRAAQAQDRYPEMLGILTRYNSFLFQGYLGSHGGRMMNGDETAIAFVEEPGQRAFELVRRFGEAGQSETDMTRSQARQAFTGGTVAILVDSSSSLARFEETTEGSFEIGTAQLPLIADEARLPAAGIASVMLTQDEERQDAAWRFMRFVASPEAQAIVGRTTGYVPANSVAVERADILGDYYAERPNMNAALSSVPIAMTWYAFPGENAARIDDAIEDRLGEVMTLRQTPTEAMQALEAEVQSMLAD